MLRLLTWNLHAGRASKALAMLRTQLAPHLTFLQESRPLGESPGVLWEEVPGNGWGSAVLCTSGRVERIGVPDYVGWVVGGRYLANVPEIPSVPLYVFSLHAPTATAERTRRGYVKEVVEIVNRIRALTPIGAHLLIGGDFNFKSFGERGADENLKTAKQEAKALATFAEAGVVPLWQAVHPSERLPQTLRWGRDPTVPFHCDGFLLTEGLAKGALCEVLTAKHLRAASDHNPVAAWL